MTQDTPTIPIDVLRDLADSFERDAEANESAARNAANQPEQTRFGGKADAYYTVANRLREYADNAGGESGHAKEDF